MRQARSEVAARGVGQQLSSAGRLPGISSSASEIPHESVRSARPADTVNSAAPRALKFDFRSGSRRFGAGLGASISKPRHACRRALRFMKSEAPLHVRSRFMPKCTRGSIATRGLLPYLGRANLPTASRAFQIRGRLFKIEGPTSTHPTVKYRSQLRGGDIVPPRACPSFVAIPRASYPRASPRGPMTRAHDPQPHFDKSTGAEHHPEKSTGPGGATAHANHPELLACRNRVISLSPATSASRRPKILPRGLAALAERQPRDSSAPTRGVSGAALQARWAHPGGKPELGIRDGSCLAVGRTLVAISRISRTRRLGAGRSRYGRSWAGRRSSAPRLINPRFSIGVRTRRDGRVVGAGRL